MVAGERAFGARRSQVPRRRRRLSVTGLSAILAMVALAPRLGLAQSTVPEAGTDFLAPTIDGDPANPPRFRKPGTVRAHAQRPAAADGPIFEHHGAFAHRRDAELRQSAGLRRRRYRLRLHQRSAPQIQDAAAETERRRAAADHDFRSGETDHACARQAKLRQSRRQNRCRNRPKFIPRPPRRVRAQPCRRWRCRSL